MGLSSICGSLFWVGVRAAGGLTPSHQPGSPSISNKPEIPAIATPAALMEPIELIHNVISTLQGLQLDQAALLAGVTLVTAAIVYLLLDALRYRAIPELNVPLTEGRQ